MANHVPLRIPRLIALTLTQWTAVLVGGFQARALVILEQKQSFIANGPLPDGVLHGGDVVASGAVQIAAAGVAGFTCLAAGLWILFRSHAVMPRSIHLMLLGSVVFLLASDLASTIVATTHSAVITTSPSLPQSVIDGLVRSTGNSLRYIDTWQVVAYVVCGWICWLFLFISAALELVATRKQKASPAQVQSPNQAQQSTHISDSSFEKGSLEHQA